MSMDNYIAIEKLAYSIEELAAFIHLVSSENPEGYSKWKTSKFEERFSPNNFSG
jgi:hypothetical protein